MVLLDHVWEYEDPSESLPPISKAESFSAECSRSSGGALIVVGSLTYQHRNNSSHNTMAFLHRAALLKSVIKATSKFSTAGSVSPAVRLVDCLITDYMKRVPDARRMEALMR
jgi:hypothetical protein